MEIKENVDSSKALFTIDMSIIDMNVKFFYTIIFDDLKGIFITFKLISLYEYNNFYVWSIVNVTETRKRNRFLISS